MTALPTVGEINYPSAQDIRDGALRTMKLGLARVGINLNTLPGSDPCAGAVIDIPMRLDDLVVDPKAWVARVDAEFDALHFDVTAPATSRSS